MELKTKIYLENEGGKFMGMGVLWLLQRIQNLGSLRQASKEMGISYSKAYNMIDHLETALGCSFLERRRGGNDRVGVSLTPFAAAFLNLYDSFQNECKGLCVSPYERFCSDLEELKRKHFK